MVVKEYGLEIWGDYACFTRPEFKVERVSYDVPTPSSIRNIFQAIFWKPAIQWEVTRIEVVNPIKRISIKRNEVGAVASSKSNAKPIYIDSKRQQRNTIMLKDVRYRVYAKMVYIQPENRPGEQKRESGADECPRKYQEIFERRVSRGEYYSCPYFGTRECVAYYKPIDVTEKGKSDLLNENRDLGVMLYDMDFSNKADIKPMFYFAEMNNGVIEVPDKKLVLR